MRVLAAIVLTASLVASASAADLAVEPVATPVGPLPDWTGLYAGVHAGYATGATTDSLECYLLDEPIGSVSWITDSGHGCESDRVAVSALHNIEDSSWLNFDDLSDMSGWLGGVQLGYRQQWGEVVAGAEVSASLAHISDTAGTFIVGDGFAANFDSALTANWLVLGTGSVGFAIGDNLLVSALGGAALGGLELTAYTGNSIRETALGYTLGVQGDLRLSDTVSVFASYNYVNFPDVQYVDEPAGGDITTLYEYDTALHVVKLGLNYALR